jgi:succinoglycan biosynthesis protein ExoA
LINKDSIDLISIVLPVYNERENIRVSLEQVFNQEGLPVPIEVIVADGMSSDGTREILQQMQAQHTNLFIIDNPEKIASTGLNCAIRIAKGGFLIRIDAHTKIAADYIKNCLETFHRTGADNVGGKMTSVGITKFGQAAALAASNPFGVGGSRFHFSEKEEEVDSVYLGAWPREVFSRIGLFDEELVRDQDDEFNYRLREHGGKIILNPDIKSVYTVRSTRHALWDQYFQYGFWKVRVMQKHPRQMSIRHFVPPLFVAAMIGAIIISLFTFWGYILLVLVGSCYLLATLMVSLITSFRKGWNHFIQLLISFAILHISYGSGFLAGLVKFWNRWGDKKGRVPEWRPVND